MGLRFHAARGSMSVGQSQGGLPPDSVVEDEAAMLKDTQRLTEQFHDPARHAMQRIVVAPSSPFSISRGLMRDAALLFCHAPRVVTNVVGGRVRVRDGELVAAELPLLVERHNRLAAQLLA